jgi:hypothetical protein
VIRLADRTLVRFEPIVMAQDLATSVVPLSDAIEAIPNDRLESEDTELLVTSVEESLKALR